VILPKYAYFQGKFVPYGEAKLGLLTHSLNYGTAAFAGIRAYWNVRKNSSLSSARWIIMSGC